METWGTRWRLPGVVLEVFAVWGEVRWGKLILLRGRHRIHPRHGGDWIPTQHAMRVPGHHCLLLAHHGLLLAQPKPILLKVLHLGISPA